jgi:hypothetical protein
MMNKFLITLIFCVFLCISCDGTEISNTANPRSPKVSAASETPIGSASLLLKIEERIIAKDQIIEYRIFDNGLINKTVIYDTDQNNLYRTNFQRLNHEKLEQAKDFTHKLRDLNYINHFPWKEDFYKRNNVIKIEFAGHLSVIPFQGSKVPENLEAPTVYYFYSGLENEPALFREIYDFILGAAS